MTCAQIIMWFAKRSIEATPERIVFLRLGDVREELDHLVSLGILNYGIRARNEKPCWCYSLSRWSWYRNRDISPLSFDKRQLLPSDLAA